MTLEVSADQREQVAAVILDRDLNHGDVVSGAPYAEHVSRKTCDVHLRLMRVPPRRYVGERRRPFMADCADYAAMPAGDGIAARPRIGLLHVSSGENALILDQDDTDAVV